MAEAAAKRAAMAAAAEAKKAAKQKAKQDKDPVRAINVSLTQQLDVVPSSPQAEQEEDPREAWKKDYHQHPSVHEGRCENANLR